VEFERLDVLPRSKKIALEQRANHNPRRRSEITHVANCTERRQKSKREEK
jgi:hypothetical protein